MLFIYSAYRARSRVHCTSSERKRCRNEGRRLLCIFISFYAEICSKHDTFIVKEDHMRQDINEEKTITSPWIRNLNSQSSFRLFCFPYVGGGASIFRTWQDVLPS